jgi:hypothetical protein
MVDAIADWSAAWAPSMIERMKWIVYPVLAIALSVPFASAVERSEGTIATGTEWETPWYRIESGEPGPVLVLTGGIHGNEPAGWLAADQIRHWPIVRGTLVVLPEANRLALAEGSRRFPGLEGDSGDLNRHFPRTDDAEKTLSPLAEEIWAFVKKQEPDWVIDLHEGFAVRRKNSKSVGSTILCDATEETRPLFEHCIATVNASIDDPENLFLLIDNSRTANGSLVRASMDRLGAHGAILETTYNDFAPGIRIRQHRLMVWRLLRNLEMIANGPDDLVFEDPDDPRKAIAIYYGPGAFGGGPLALRRTLREEEERYSVRIIGPEEVRNGSLEQFDLVIFPGGSGSRQAAGIGDEGQEAVRDYVRDGGGYIGICGGCYLACENFSWSLGILDAKTKSSKWRRGKKMLELAFSESGRELLEPANEVELVKYQNGPVMAPAESPTIPDFVTFATFQTEVADNDTPEGIQVDSPAILGGSFGRGRVVGISPHPEQTENLTHFVPELIEWCLEKVQ